MPTVHAVRRMHTVRNEVARTGIAMIKVAVPAMADEVIDWAIQAHGGAYAMARVMRLGDGPDQVQREPLGKLELRRYA